MRDGIEAQADAMPARVPDAGDSFPESFAHARLAALTPDLAERGEALEGMAHASTLPPEETAAMGRAHCQRCEVLPRALEGPGTLYLSLPHTHTLGKAMGWLRRSGLEYDERNGILSVIVPEGSLAPVVGPLADLLSSTERVHTRVAFQPGAHASRLLALFAVEDLATFAARADSDWLLDLLRERRLTSWFQPIVECGTGRLFAYECLLRGEKDGAAIPPGPIFEAARRADLTFQTDLAARRSAFVSADRTEIQDRLFVNFTPNGIFDARHCLDSTVRLVDELGIERSRVVFEVTESERLPDLDHLRDIVGYYRDKGFGFALDDVGSGFSSLQALLGLQPDYVKVDMSLVRNVDVDPRKAVLTSGLLGAAHELGAKTIIEGVETEGEWAWAREHGAHYAQGYLFGKPSPRPVSTP